VWHVLEELLKHVIYQANYQLETAMACRKLQPQTSTLDAMEL
jgi:hypothetical protein